MERTGETARIDITYYTDPLCCWSWAFEPHRLRLQEEFGRRINWRICMGGLLPAWRHFSDPEQMVSRPIQMGPVWMQAGEVGGVKIQHRIWKEDPPASSYPACIAVKCAGLQSDEIAAFYLQALQRAVMLKGINISRIEALYSLAEDLQRNFPSFNLPQFLQDLTNERGIDAFRKDLAEVNARGIRRFPSLLIKGEDGRSFLLSGYRTFDDIVAAIPFFQSATSP
jgi:putative protein-disulfide isomerase